MTLPWFWHEDDEYAPDIPPREGEVMLYNDTYGVFGYSVPAHMSLPISQVFDAVQEVLERRSRPECVTWRKKRDEDY